MDPKHVLSIEPQDRMGCSNPFFLVRLVDILDHFGTLHVPKIVGMVGKKYADACRNNNQWDTRTGKCVN